MIKFEEISIQNFLSVGNSPIVVNLCKDDLTAIIGKNGSGKTTIASAICFALYNKPYRDITKPQLVNSINQKKCLVELKFSVSGKSYVVKRGIKPNLFEIYENGKLIDQDSASSDYQEILEVNIIKMNYRAFTQIVLMGTTSYVPFMKLKPDQRREFVEDLLDIKIFSEMAKVLSQKIKDTKNELKLLETDETHVRDTISLLEETISNKKDEIEQEIATLQSEIDSNTERVGVLNLKIEESAKKLKVKKEIKKELKVHEDTLDQLEAYKRKITKNLSSLTSSIEEHANMDVCETCHQQVSESAKETYKASVSVKIAEYNNALDKLKLKLDDVQEKLVAVDSINEEIESLNSSISSMNQDVYGINLLITRRNSDIKTLKGKKVSGDETTTKLKEYASKLIDIGVKKKKLLEEQAYQKIAERLLKDDGVKAKVVKQYIPVMNKLINKYLHDLDFFVSFNIDENFNEVVKSRHRDNFTYDNFSEGEKKRLDFALMLTWREIAKAKNSVATNLLFIDELLELVDGVGGELIVKLFRSIKDTNIFLITHRDYFIEKFDNVIALEKKNNFTVISR